MMNVPMPLCGTERFVTEKDGVQGFPQLEKDVKEPFELMTVFNVQPNTVTQLLYVCSQWVT